MSQIQVPPVTLEDLQAFHTKHFPTTTTIKPLQPPLSQIDDIHLAHEENHNADDDDLGYYPDGVKRTLTDEQIRIFRHSEIHALLRERQIREENEEYERKFGDNPQSGAGNTTGEGGLEKKVASASASPDQNDNDQAKLNAKVVAGTKRATHETGAGSSEPAAKRHSTSTSTSMSTGPGDVHLDYNEESVAPRPSRGQGQAASQFAGRKIVSYDD